MDVTVFIALWEFFRHCIVHTLHTSQFGHSNEMAQGKYSVRYGKKGVISDAVLVRSLREVFANLLLICCYQDQ